MSDIADLHLSHFPRTPSIVVVWNVCANRWRRARYDESQAEVKYDAEVLTPEEIERGVTGLGYKCQHTRTVTPGKSGGGGAGGRGEGSGGQPNALEVEVTGMSCTSCSGKVGYVLDHRARAVLDLVGLIVV